LQGEERFINVMPIKEAWEVNSKENARIFYGMEEGGLLKNARDEKDIQEGMKNVPCMTRMEWCGKKIELVNHVGAIITKGRIVTCDIREHILDNHLGEVDVGVTILNCPNDRS
jgi:hypothetical protein